MILAVKLRMSADTEKMIATPIATSTTNVTSNNNNNENEHLLEHKWVLWFRPPISHQNQGKSWETSQKLRFSTETVEDFWRGYRKTQRITRSHPVNCDYSLFREGISPAWEDPFNENGGRWTYNIERRHSNNTNISMPELIEQIWLDVMLCLIGEGFDPYGNSIAGGVCGIRPNRGGGKNDMGAKIHIWIKNASDTETNMGIGKILKECVHAPDGSLTFAPHERENANRRPNLKLTL